MKKINVYVVDDDLQFLVDKTEWGYGPAIVIQAAIEQLRILAPDKCLEALFVAQIDRKRVDKRRSR